MPYRTLIAGLFFFFSASSIALADDESSRFHEAYPCEHDDPKSVCVVGSIPREADVTLVANDQAVSAKAVRDLPDQFSSSTRFTGTLLETSEALPPADKLLAILAPRSAVSAISPRERTDPRLVAKAENFLREMGRKFTFGPGREQRWFNPRLTTKIIGLSADMSIVEVEIHFDWREKDELGPTEAACKQCQEEDVTLFARGGHLFELLNRGDNGLCSHFASAFRLFGRVHLFTTANGCGNDEGVAQVQDVSGPAARTVYRNAW